MNHIKGIISVLGCFLVLSCTETYHGMTSQPYLSQVTEKSMVVSWHTPVPELSVVEYGETEAYGLTARVNERTKFHSVTLTGLKPSTKYYYRILSAKKTEVYQFHTAVKAGGPFSFVVYGDGRPNERDHVNVLKQILKANPLFIVNTGDLVWRDEERRWHDYFWAVCEKTNTAQTIPIYYTMGNHDGAGSGDNAEYYRYFALPVNSFFHNEAFYSFNIGDAHFISLNSYLPYDPGSPQYEWLVEDLRQSAGYKWKFVFFHEPPYSTGKHGSNLNVRRILAPLFEKGGVDVVFAGHNHLYERTVNIKGVTYIVTAGGGAPLYNPTKQVWTAAMDKSHHFCRVRLEGNRCEVTMIRSNGTIGDRFDLSKQTLPRRPGI